MSGNNSKSRSLVLMAVLLAVVILLAAWFLLLSPVLSGASEASANAAEQEQSNSQTQVEVNKLREQFAHMDEYQTQLEALQVQIPTAPMYPDLQRMFSDVAAKHKVVITTLQFDSAVAMEIKAPTQDSDTTDGATPAPTPSPSAAAEPAGDPSADIGTGGAKATTGLYAIPVSVTMLGKYDDVMSALKELQTKDGRLVLITDVTLTRGVDAGTTTTNDATKNETTGVFSGSVFVVTGSAPTEAAPDTSASPSPSPSPTS